MEKITAIQVLDVPVHPYSMDAAVQYLDDKIQEQKHSFVVTANAEIIMMCQDDAEYKNILTNVADLVLPDGAGTVWAGRQLGYAVPERVAGFDLFNRLLNLCAAIINGIYYRLVITVFKITIPASNYSYTRI